MRSSLPLAALLAAALLAGCTEGTPAAAPAGDDPLAPPDDVSPIESRPHLPRLRFAAPEFNDTVTFSGEFANPDTCFLLAECGASDMSFDVTDLVPADAPVELAVTVTTDTCANAHLSWSNTRVFRYEADDAGLSAMMVRTPEGTVSIEVDHCSLLSIGETSYPVSVEVRSVVRADVLPPYMPVLVALAPGDRIEAMGDSADGIDDLVVVPPGRSPIHVTEGTSFDVGDGLPAGDYVVMVKGSEGMLHGPANTTLAPAKLEYAVGEDRPIASGQPLTWTASVPGVPAFATLYLLTGTAGGVENGQVSYNSGYTLAIRQGGADLATSEQDSCVAPCSLNGPGGQFMDWAATGLFPERLGLGDVEFEVTNDSSQGLHAYEVIGYIVTS